MIYFGNRRPRGFHYTYRFHNERRELLEDLRRGIAPETLAERSLNDGNQCCDNSTNQHSGRHRNSQAFPIWLSVMAMLLLLLLCLILVALN